MKSISSKNSNVSFLCGLFFINLIACTLLLAAVTFILNGTITFLHFPAAFILSLLVNYFAGKHLRISNKENIRSCLIIAGVTIGSLIIGAYYYDVSYDGQSYHQEIIYQLKNGWNPYHTTLPDSVSQALFANHYSKGAEIPQSMIYSMLHHIEAGKATNFMLLAAAFCLTLSFFVRSGKLSVKKSVWLSLLITFNPVTLTQLVTYYVDGQLATLFVCFIIAALIAIKAPTRYNLLLLGSIIIITVNIKFTAVVEIVLFTVALLGWAIFTKRIVLAKKLFYTSFITGIVGILIVGYNPYITNTITNQHPFYPLMGKNKIDILTNQLPLNFKDKNGAEQFFMSLFAHTNDNPTTLIASLKIPFTLNRDDIVYSSKIGIHLAGFGPFFSGVFLLCCLLLIILYATANDPPLLKNVSWLLLIIIISVCIIPGSWWARYVPQFWFVPVIILAASEFATENRWIRILKPIIYVLTSINIGFTIICLPWSFLQTNIVGYQIKKLQAAHKTVVVQWGVCKANRIRFQEHHIPYTEANLDHTQTEDVFHSDSKFIVPDKNINLPKSIFVKWGEKLSGKAQ